MKCLMEKFIIIADGEIIKTYTNFKTAMKDSEFFKLMYKEIGIYRLIVKDGNPV